MPARFVDQIVRCTAKEYQPITPPDDPHPTRGNWVNGGVESCKAIFGAAEYEKESRNDIPWPMPAAMVRAILTNQPLTAEGLPPWRFGKM